MAFSTSATYSSSAIFSSSTIFSSSATFSYSTTFSSSSINFFPLLLFLFSREKIPKNWFRFLFAARFRPSCEIHVALYLPSSAAELLLVDDMDMIQESALRGENGVGGVSTLYVVPSTGFPHKDQNAISSSDSNSSKSAVAVVGGGRCQGWELGGREESVSEGLPNITDQQMVSSSQQNFKLSHQRSVELGYQSTFSSSSRISRPMMQRRNLAAEERADASSETFAKTSLSTNFRQGSEGEVGEGVTGGALCPDAVSRSFENNFFLTSQGHRGFGQNQPQQGQIYPDARRGFMGGGTGEMGFMGGPMQGSPSFCYGCSSWGFSYPVTAF